MTSRRRFAAVSAVGRALAAFALALAFWFAFSEPYERLLAETAEALMRATERPPVTRLLARGGEVLIERVDLPPAMPRPGLPAADLHFNLALLAALFAIDRRPLQAARVAAFLVGCFLLFVVHAAALVIQVRSVYTTGLGAWSAAHYGAVARNFWSGAFHFYQIAGRFAAPFAIWWLLRRPDEASESGPAFRRGSNRRD